MTRQIPMASIVIQHRHISGYEIISKLKWELHKQWSFKNKKETVKDKSLKFCQISR